MTKDEALQMCLEYIETDAHERKYVRHAIKAALEAKDEPVGKFAKFTDGIWREVTEGSAGMPLYTTPSQRTWVGLTDEEIDEGLLRSDYALQTAHAWRAGVVFAMTQLKERNT